MKLKVLKEWKNKKPIFEEDNLTFSILEERLKNFHTEELKEKLQKTSWRKRCNTTHCFVGGKSIYKNGKELISYIQSQVPKVYDNNRINFLNETDKEIDSIIDAYFFQDNLIDKGRILVQAGHFIPDLNNLKNSSFQSLKGLEDGLNFIKKIYQEGGSADLMLYVNDVHMLKGEKIRKDFRENLVIPENYVSLINEYVNEIEKITYEQKRENDFKIFFTSEKQLYNKSLREAKKNKNLKKEGTQYITKSGIIIADTFSGDHISQIKCDSACMRLNMLSDEMNYSSLVNFYPTCAKKGIENRTMTAFNDLNPNSNLNIFNVYKTYTCWVDKKSKFIYEHEAKKMNLIKNELELEKILFEIIKQTDKSIKIIGGHLPLLYNDEGKGKKSVEYDVDRWGEFSNYTFELSCMGLKYAQEQEKEGKIIILVDDLVEIPIKEFYEDGKTVRESVTKTLKKKRSQLYDSGIIPESYKKILSQYGLSKDDLVTHKRKSGKKTKMISEISAKSIATNKGLTSANECAHAYKGIIYNKDFFDIDKDYLISFIPDQCKGNICRGLLNKSSDLNALHLFFPHMEDLGGLMQLKDGTYVKNPKINPLTKEEMYQRGITYRFDKAK